MQKQQQQTDPLTEAMVNKRDPLATGELNKITGEIPTYSEERTIKGSDQEGTRVKEPEQAPAPVGEKSSNQEELPTATDASDILVVRRSLFETDSSLE
ncbi:hypothetical protein R1flu_021953 [Riccia fluitans]|uniref:Uncharacterized protein n=1 Tax=Riccia fluitans TaxID=41844 RepID=A0ABD1ZSD0_9MARC